MNEKNELKDRFGIDATDRLTPLLAPAPDGDASLGPAQRDRCRGAMIGLLAGESLAAALRGVRGGPGPDTRLALTTANAVLAGVDDHPVRFAERLATADVRSGGMAAEKSQASLIAGMRWWEAAASNSAGAAAAARSSPFGLLWAGDPERAAFEAALSATVTHGHQAAVAGAAALAAAVALAAGGNGRLDRAWLTAVADICAGYPQRDVNGRTVAEVLRTLPDYLGGEPEGALAEIGRSALATEAVPVALLGAAAVPEPFTAVFGDSVAWSGKGAAALHPACLAMMGACVGARHGEATWTNWGETLPPPGIPRDIVVRTWGYDAVLATADRIADRGERPAAPRQQRREGEENGLPVHVSFLIDRSGSMSGLQSDVVDGFNGFVARQRNHPGKCTLTLVQFDSNDPCEVIHDAVPVEQVPDLTVDRYQPRGLTPLLDALGMLIGQADARLSRLGHDEDQIVAVFTDGLENASRRWSRARLFDRISACRNAGWTFVFMGANQDSYAEAGSLGLDRGSIQNFRADRKGANMAFHSMERAVGEYRSARARERAFRKRDFFAGRKEAEEDYERRGQAEGRRPEFSKADPEA